MTMETPQTPVLHQAVCPNEDSSQFLDPGEFKALMQDLQPVAPIHWISAAKNGLGWASDWASQNGRGPGPAICGH